MFKRYGIKGGWNQTQWYEGTLEQLNKKFNTNFNNIDDLTLHLENTFGYEYYSCGLE